MWLIMASWDSFIFNIFLICLIKTGLHFFLSSTIDIGLYYTTPKTILSLNAFIVMVSLTP